MPGNPRRSGPVLVYQAKILSVDKVKWTCRIQSTVNNKITDGVPVEPTFVNAEGGGQFFMPEVNGIVWCCEPSKSSDPFIFCYATLPLQADEGDDSEDPNDRRFNRPVLEEGDMMIGASETGKVLLRKGGVLEIGASESAKRIYIPLQNIIREFSQNYEHHTGGGSLTMLCRDDDETFGSELTPAEFNFEWREFCEDDVPIIDFRLGRVKAEDDQKIPLGELGTIVATFNINNRWQVWIDKQGNCATLIQGKVHHSYVGARYEYNNASLSQFVTGLLAADYGTRVTDVRTTDTLKVGRDRTVEVGGQLTETIKRGIFRETGPIEETVGDIKREVQGSVEELILNNETKTIGSNHVLGVGQQSSETIGRKKSISVAGPPVPTDTALDISVSSGKMVVHTTTGKQVYATGADPAIPQSKITLKVTGAIILSSIAGTVTYEQNGSGIMLSTPAGKISMDLAGVITLGPQIGGVYGNVVTTVTHPVDRVTGTPILGCPTVQAGLLAPPLPGPSPGAPPGSGINTFIPDLTP